MDDTPPANTIPCQTKDCPLLAGYDLSRWPPVPQGDRMPIYYLCEAGHTSTVWAEFK